MRPTTIATQTYSPSPIPSDPKELPVYLEREFAKIKAMLELLQLGHIDPTYVEPVKPREGDIRLADGTHWNPLGTGQKFVGYRGGAWVLLG